MEAASDRGVQGGVYLDCTPIPADRIALRHAYLAETLQKHAVDIARDWLVVSPATHFMMGGIAIGPDAASSLPGLYVAGESAAGIHGANRLGGNAFCEGLVFGTIAGEAAAAFARSAPPAPTPVPVPESLARLVDPSAPDPRPKLSELWQYLRDQMWNHAAIVRERRGLDAAMAVIAEVRGEAQEVRGRTAAEAARALDLLAALDSAQAIVAAALFREESRGAHWRSDYPDTATDWLGSILMAWPESQSSPTLTYRAKSTLLSGSTGKP
jgi:aspartate oxidase